MRRLWLPGMWLPRIHLSWHAGLWLMLAPYLLGTLLLVALPALMSGVLAFTSYDALSPPVFVGFANFRLLAADPTRLRVPR